MSIIVKKMNNTQSLMTDMNSKDAIKLDIVELYISQTYPKKRMLPADGLYKYLYQPREQHGDKKKELLTLSEVKIRTG